jgi:geranylgeranyl transferase type-2 subunit beta
MTNSPSVLLKDLHVSFLRRLLFSKGSYEQVLTFPIRTNTYYWGLSALYLLNGLNSIDSDAKSQIIDEIVQSQTSEGGLAGHVGGDAHIHYTLSGIQALILLDAFDRLNHDRIATWIATLQKEDGSFMADKWGEVDTRFVYCALASLSLIRHLEVVDVGKAVDWLRKCQNFDGGFGVVEGCESHAGQVFTCVGALAIANALEKIDKDGLGFWLSERQDPTGGFNGRPEKLPDVCYSWWVGAPIAIIGKQNWVDADKLEEFVLASQDPQDGGISDRPGNVADPFHTFLGVAGLSLFGKLDVPRMNPIYALPIEVVERHFGSFE